MKYFLFYCLGFLFSCSDKSSELTIVFTGDVNLSRGVADERKIHGDTKLEQALYSLPKHDFLFINLEGTLTESGTPRNDRYNFRSSEKDAAVLKKMGVSHVSLANNHSFDFGEKGYANTLKALERSSLSALGASSQPTIIKQGNQRCAVLAASLAEPNKHLAISSADSLKKCVEAFEKQSPDVPLILYLHWGLEYQLAPSDDQRKLARRLIDLGTDAIIGHHPHVTQTVEFVEGKPVVYSLGNFIADAYLPNTDRGLAVRLSLKQNQIRTELIPIQLSDYFAHIPIEKEQIEDLKHHLGFSKEISAIQHKEGWQLKPLEGTDFQEDSDCWLMADKGAFSVVKKLEERSYLIYAEKENIRSNPINVFGILSEIALHDINEDGNVDLLLGIAKKVDFDPVEAKRIQIYTLKGTALKPLWLGTRFIHPVESFHVEYQNRKPYLVTRELNEDGGYCIGKYQWDHFGFSLTERIDIQ